MGPRVSQSVKDETPTIFFIQQKPKKCFLYVNEKPGNSEVGVNPAIFFGRQRKRVASAADALARLEGFRLQRVAPGGTQVRTAGSLSPVRTRSSLQP